MIYEGANGTFVGSQETIFKANRLVREAMSNDYEKSKKEEYLSAFNLVKCLYGLTEEQEKRYEDLKNT